MAAFVQATFNNKTKQIFSKLISEITDTADLYYSDSPEAQHIQGDMTPKLHLTIYYGLPLESVDNTELLSLINHNKFNTIKLGNLFFIPGYQNLYKVLCIEVTDEDSRLYDLSKKISKFALEEKYLARFKPHLTLAYVQNDFVVPNTIPVYPDKIEVESLVISTSL